MILVNGLLQFQAMRRVKALVFDCDGVLFDSMESNKQYYNTILDRMGLAPMTPSQERFVHAHAVRRSLDHITPPERKGDVDKARTSVNYRRDILPHLKPEPGLFEFLERAKAAGLDLALFTNRTTTMDLLTARFGLDRYFSLILTASKVTPKPHPEGLNAILRAFRLKPQDSAYIGDTDVDERAARAAKVPLWSYRNPRLLAAFLIPDFWSLSQGMGFGLKTQRRMTPAPSKTNALSIFGPCR